MKADVIRRAAPLFLALVEDYERAGAGPSAAGTSPEPNPVVGTDRGDLSKDAA